MIPLEKITIQHRGRDWPALIACDGESWEHLRKVKDGKRVRENG